jgi:protein CMS1
VLPTLHKRLSQSSKSNGAPTLIFVAGAALRAADVTRILRGDKLRGKKGGEVAKLFARHFRLHEHVAHLKNTKVGAAVGTPGRIGKLLCDTGEQCLSFFHRPTLSKHYLDAFTLSALTHIILDVTYRDAKQMSLLDISQVRDEVFKSVLGCSRVIEGIKAGKIQVVLF